MVLGLEPQDAMPVVRLQGEGQAMNEVMDHLNARARWQTLANEVAFMLPLAAISELRYELAVLGERGQPVSIAVEALDQAYERRRRHDLP